MCKTFLRKCKYSLSFKFFRAHQCSSPTRSWDFSKEHLIHFVSGPVDDVIVIRKMAGGALCIDCMLYYVFCIVQSNNLKGKCTMNVNGKAKGSDVVRMKSIACAIYVYQWSIYRRHFAIEERLILPGNNINSIF